jgi:hypothetical protein
MRTRAEGLRAEAQGAFTRESVLAGMIPMGQPILVGHHSEKRHRRDLARMHSLMKKGLTLTKEAETLERRAAFAEKNTAVSSDDHDALPKLRAKLAALEAARAKMREANATIRKGGDVVPRLVGLGFTEARAKQLLEKDYAGRVGFPDYKLKNTSSEEKRLKDRIRQLEARAASPPRPAERLGDSTVHESENRVRITFPSKPPEDMRRALTSAGFRWSPTAGAWQRFASASAWSEARRILEKHGGAAASVPARAPTAAMSPPQG